MTVKEKNRLSMYLTVNDYLVLFASIIASIPIFATLQAKLADMIHAIRTQRETQEVSNSGLTTSKNTLKEKLIEQALDILKKVEAYALITGNKQLMTEIHYSGSSLRNSPDNILYDRCMVIYNKANTNIANLATYNVTAANLTDFLTNINAFGAYIPKPNIGKIEKKNATEKIKDAFDEAESCLKQMDALVEVIRSTQPDFYMGYKKARKVPDTAGTSVSLKVIVKEKSDDEPIKGVTLVIKNTNSSSGDSEIVKKSAEKGQCLVKSMDEGVYTIAAPKSGYKDLTQNIVIADGEMSTLEVLMECM